MATIDERIAALEVKLKQEKARKQQIEARRRAAESKVKRSQDTRRKILVGAAILAKVERGEWPETRLLEMMSKTLTRADDRALFDLPAIQPQQPAAEAPPAAPAAPTIPGARSRIHPTLPNVELPDWADWSDQAADETDADYIFRKALEMPPETQRKFIGEHNR